MTPPPKQTDTPPPLVAGVDYYIEAGRWVFTSTFHLKRGSCCNSGCRHCPYDHAPADGLDRIERRAPFD